MTPHSISPGFGQPQCRRRRTPENPLLAVAMAAAIALAGGACEQPVVTPPDDLAGPPAFVIGGEPDFAHDNVGAMMTFHPFIPGNPLSRLCSGTLIAPNVVVTAGHCAFFIVAFGLPVWFTFDQQLSEDSPLIPATAIPHPNFAESKRPDDVSEIGGDPHELGVLILDVSVTYRTPAVLPAAGLLDDLKKQKLLRARDEFTVVGYGCSGFTETGDPLFDGQRRSARVPFGALMGEAVQFSNPHSAPSICRGDSGGPNLLELSGQEVLTSVTWWGGNLKWESWHRAYRLDIPQARSFLGNYVVLP